MKLEGAPISNLSAERSVGSVNYELSVRGNKELRAASAAHVKGKAAELLKNKPLEKRFLEMAKKDGPLDVILKTWEERQSELERERLDCKESASLAVDRQRNSDLQALVAQGGPFTSPEAIEAYLGSTSIAPLEKNARLYLEVRHAKNASIAFPKASEVFRLKKKGKNLDTETYATNLKAYLRRLTCHVNMEHADFQRALEELRQ